MTEEDRKPTGTTGVEGGGSKFKATLPDMPPDNVFMCGNHAQVPQFVKAEKGLREWIGRNSTNEMYNYIKDGTEPTFTEPAEPTADKGEKISPAKMEKYKMQLKMSMEKKEKFEQDKGRLFRSITSLCTPALQQKLEANSKYNTLEGTHNIRGLMDLIKEIVYGADEGKEPYWTMQATMVKIHTIYQFDRESTGDYHDRFLAQLKVTESIWGPLIPSTTKGKPTAQQDAARNAYLARLFLRGLNRKRFNRDIEELGNDYVSGNDNYPKDVASALSWITNRSNGRPQRPNTTKFPTSDDEGAHARSFHQQPPQSKDNNNDDDSSASSQSATSGHNMNQATSVFDLRGKKNRNSRTSWATP